MSKKIRTTPWANAIVESVAGLVDWIGLGPVVRQLWYDQLMGLSETEIAKMNQNNSSMISILNSTLQKAYDKAGEKYNQTITSLPPNLSSNIRKAVATATKRAEDTLKKEKEELSNLERRVDTATDKANMVAGLSRSSLATKAGDELASSVTKEISDITKDLERKITEI